MTLHAVISESQTSVVLLLLTQGESCVVRDCPYSVHGYQSLLGMYSWTGDPPTSKLIIDRKYFLTVIETCGLAGIFV